jgi:hypothetical protein
MKVKKLTNHRASGSDAATNITPKTLLTLEECMEYIQQDECIEVTPNFIRMRKLVLDENERTKLSKQQKGCSGITKDIAKLNTSRSVYPVGIFFHFYCLSYLQNWLLTELM